MGAKTIGRSAHERFDPGYIRVAETIQFRQLDDQTPWSLHRSVLAPKIHQFIGEVFTCERPKCSELTNALRTFENQATVCLRAWTE